MALASASGQWQAFWVVSIRAWRWRPSRSVVLPDTFREPP